MRSREFIVESTKVIYYHVSETKNEQDILDQGIHRKDKDWPLHFTDFEKGIALDINPDAVYKQRIYLFKNNDRALITKFMGMVFAEKYDLSVLPDQPFLLVPFTVFGVDITNLPHKFHKDQASNDTTGTVWTDSDDIPADRISISWRSNANMLTDPKYKDNLTKVL